ncbi:hypothetical protein KEM54_006410 [Ascosphaera aggregata]|nr:hypothetical protein KEM54_006410 [Ascosphaera aggregata]
MKPATATTLNANPVVEIPISSTGGYPHVDVCFNPWYQQEVAIIDTRGNWSIWDLSRWLSHRNIWRAQCSKSGAIHPESNGDLLQSPRKSFTDDAWARIMWLGDVHCLLACKRRKAVIIHLADEITYHPVNLKYLRNSEWIIDLVRSRSNISDAFILTTLRIVWISLATDDFNTLQQPSAPRAKVLLEWFHYRDAEDLGLRLSLLQIGPESSLVLYSQLNPLAQIYRFSYSPIDPSIPVSVADPSMLQLPTGNTQSKSTSANRIRDTYSTLVFQEIENSIVDNPLDPSGCQRLIKLLAQRADNSLVESLYIARTAKTEDYSELELFDPSGRAKEDRYPLSTKATAADFVVEDWYEQPVPLPRHFTLPSNSRQKDKSGFPVYMDLSRLYHLLCCGNVMSGVVEKKMPLETATTAADQSDGLLEAIVASTTALTLNDVLNGEELLIDDFEKSAEALRTLPSRVKKRAFSTNLTLQPTYLRVPYSFCLPSPIMTRGSPNANFIYDTYDGLVRDYISPLSQSLPVNNRISKERLIRNAMVELMFSQVVLSRSFPDPLGHGSDRAPPREEQLYSEADNPPTTPPDVTQSQNQPSSHMIEADEVCSALRRFTSFECENAFSPQVKTILSHWETGKDPATYDWQMASRAARELEASQASQGHRRTRRGKKERRFQATEIASLTSSSQNVPLIKKSLVGDTSKSRKPRAPSSATQVTDHRHRGLAAGKSMAYFGAVNISPSQDRAQLTMTQEERGAFGSRDSRTKAIHRHRKKKRAEGF